MVGKGARADVAQIRQTTQFTCCAASIASAIRAHGKSATEDDVNRVLGAAPMAGATWEAMLATVQYFGLRGTLVVPSTPRMLKAWTDRGIPVVIAWNPESRPWSHASVVFDVTEGAGEKLLVHVMDPNIPNPSRTTRVLDEDEFCQKWGEKVSDSLIVRRPAMAVEREVTVEGRQVIASARRVAEEYDCYKDYKAGTLSPEEYQDCLRRMRELERGYSRPRPAAPSAPVDQGQVAALEALLARKPSDFIRSILDQLRRGRRLSDAQKKAVRQNFYWANMRDKADLFRVAAEREVIRIKEEDLPKRRHGPEFVQQVLRRPGGGKHHTRERDVEKGHSRKEKHRKDWREKEAAERVAGRWLDRGEPR